MSPPPPLRTDGSNAFARHSTEVRLPRIARDVIDRNPRYTPAMKRAIEELATGIEGDAPLPSPHPPGPDVGGWSRAHAEHAHETWLATEWFHGELAFYRELLQRCRFWELSRDPFESAKEDELAGERPWERLLSALARGGTREERIMGLLDDSLWGNRVDLSYAVAASRARMDEDLVVDDRPAALPWLARPAARVHLVADNTGTELALDLALVDALLEGPGVTVTVHLKIEPVFVSDATPRDLWRLVEGMSARGGDARLLAERLGESFDAGRLVLAPDPFWSSPRFLRDAPPHVAGALNGATIVVVKGDANYRRVVGDALWPPSAPFATACDYARAPIACLRTLKSDAVLGLPTGMAERLDAAAPRWRVDGQRGLVQVFVPTTR